MARRAAGTRALSPRRARQVSSPRPPATTARRPPGRPRSLGLTATVFVPEAASRTKLAHLTRLGAEVVADRRRPRRGEGAGDGLRGGHGPSVLRGRRRAGAARRLRARSARRSSTSWTRRRRPSSCPSATARSSPASGRSLGERSPDTRRIGVVSAGAPVMALSWRAGRPVDCDLCDSIADGLAVRVAIPVAVEWLLADADDMLEVSEAEIASRRRCVRRRRHTRGSSRCRRARGAALRDRPGGPDRARRHRLQHRRRAARSCRAARRDRRRRPTCRRSFDAAIASPSTFERCPSSNVGKSGSAGIPPSLTAE